MSARIGLTPRRYEAAHSLPIPQREVVGAAAWGMNVAKRRGMARARVAVARNDGSLQVVVRGEKQEGDTELVNLAAEANRATRGRPLPLLGRC